LKFLLDSQSSNQVRQASLNILIVPYVRRSECEGDMVTDFNVRVTWLPVSKFSCRDVIVYLYMLFENVEIMRF